MAQMNLPAAPDYRRTSYSGLLGCDFSVDPSLVDKRRSPDCLNMISDEGGIPIKRKGWEIVEDWESGKVENVWTLYDNGNRYIIYTLTGTDDLHPTQSIFCIKLVWNELTIRPSRTRERIYVTKSQSYLDAISIEGTGKRCAFYTNISDEQSGLYIITSNDGIIRIHCDSAGRVACETVEPYTPTIIIARDPAQGGGEAYEEINLLTRRRKEMFLNTNGNKSFVLYSASVQSSNIVFEYLDSDGNWQPDSTARLEGSNTIKVDTAHDPIAVGRDNIRIEYTADVDDKSSYIQNCQAVSHFSSAVQDQIFLSANPDKPNIVYYSAPNNVSYFPDTNYLSIGGENKIMGFLNLGEYLAVVKEGVSDDSTIFLVYRTSLSSKTVTIDDGTSKSTSTTTQINTFAIKRAIAGIGAVSKNAFAVLNDEPLFLSNYGVYGVTSANINSEKIVRNRSFLLDQKLLKEDLSSAIATVWNNYYVIAVGGLDTKQDYIRDNDGDICMWEVEHSVTDYDGSVHIYTELEPATHRVSNGRFYILDGRHKTSNSNGNTNYGYEAYYWEGIPAISLLSFDKELWFGTADGKLCRFKNTGLDEDYSDATLMDRESDPDNLYNGIPIVARWSTPNDNDGRTEYFKTMMKKGSMCTVAPQTKSTVKVYISIDGYPREYVGSFNADVSDIFETVDFEKLSFDITTAPKDGFFRKKKKKYKRLQIILENSSVNEAFGVFEIIKTYIYQRYAKGANASKGNKEPTIVPYSGDE